MREEGVDERGDKGVYNVLTFQKSRGARAHLGGGGHMPPLPPTPK